MTCQNPHPNREQWVASLVQLVVERARVLIDDKRTWERRGFALDRNGRDVPVTSPDAVRFCAQAALTRASYTVVGTCFPALDYRKLARLAGDCVVGYDVLGHINEIHGRTRVLKLIDKFLAQAIDAEGRANNAFRATSRAQNPCALNTPNLSTFA